MEQTIEVSVWWERVRRRRGAISLLVLFATVATAVVVFVLPPWYRSSASLLPPGEDDTGLGVASLFRGIGVPGIKIPTQATPAEILLAVLQSRRLSEEIINRFDLKTVYRKPLMVDAVKELSHHAKFKLTQSGTLELSVEDKVPARARDMASAYIDLLDRFNRDVRMTKGRRTREFLQKRLADNQADLSQAERQLADYQSRHKTIALSPEASSAIETASRLYAQRAALDVRLGVIQSYSREGSDEETQVRQQMSQIDRQLAALPETGLEIVRFLRDVKKYEQLNALLTAQFEEARITEVRDVATVDVLDPPDLPERKARPRRGLLTAAAFAISLGIGLAWALTQPAPVDDRGDA